MTTHPTSDPTSGPTSGPTSDPGPKVSIPAFEATVDELFILWKAILQDSKNIPPAEADTLVHLMNHLMFRSEYGLLTDEYFSLVDQAWKNRAIPKAEMGDEAQDQVRTRTHTRATRTARTARTTRTSQIKAKIKAVAAAADFFTDRTCSDCGYTWPSWAGRTCPCCGGN